MTQLMPLPYSHPTDLSAGSDDRDHLLVLWLPQLKHMYTMSPAPVMVESAGGANRKTKYLRHHHPGFSTTITLGHQCMTAITVAYTCSQ